MKTIVEALKDLYVALGGSSSDVAELSQNVELQNAIAEKMSGSHDAQLNSDAIENIAEVARGYIKPAGKKSITSNGTVDVTEFASAEVSVPNPSTGTKPITENGVYDVTNFASADVNVAGSASAPIFSPFTIVNNSNVSINIGNTLYYSSTSGKICKRTNDISVDAGQTRVFDGMYNFSSEKGTTGIFTVSAIKTASFTYSCNVGTVKQLTYEDATVGNTRTYYLLFQGTDTSNGRTVTISGGTE